LTIYKQICNSRHIVKDRQCYQLNNFLPGGGEVQFPEVALLNIVEQVARQRMRGPLALQLEDDHAGIVTRGKQVEAGMPGDDPEAVVLAAKCVEAIALAHVPHPAANSPDIRT
jgi:hypothetical protein